MTRFFPLWTVLVAAAAFLAPAPFKPVGPYVADLLAVIMFAMGVSLSPADFGRVAVRPGPVLAGLGLHYLILPRPSPSRTRSACRPTSPRE